MIASSTEDWGTASFATPESLARMWEFVRYFIAQYMPFIMIVVAAFLVIAVLALIIQIFTRQKDDDEHPVDYM